MRPLLVMVLLQLFLVAACDKQSAAPPPSAQQATKGLPPIGSGPATGPASVGAPGSPVANPHMVNPHGANPHAGLPGGVPPAAAPGASGDTLEGTIDVAPAFKDQVKPGDVLFLVARAVDASGNVQRMPVAVDRLQVGTLPLAFRLTTANVMVAGTPFAGAMQITARIDKDGDAMTREAGDVEGSTKVTVPQKGITITLDTPVKP